ncbi:MAG: hypothetical protein FOGNACKC_00860 [Anaerolineae bacterium]|nr:hypothetical protein [Anaerolineae bacterium]
MSTPKKYQLSESLVMAVWDSGGVTFQDQTDPDADGFTLLGDESGAVGMVLARGVITGLLAQVYRMAGEAGPGNCPHLLKGSEIVTYLRQRGGWQIDDAKHGWLCRAVEGKEDVVYVSGDGMAGDIALTGSALTIIAAHYDLTVGEVVAGVVEASGKFLPVEVGDGAE